MVVIGWQSGCERNIMETEGPLPLTAGLFLPRLSSK